MQRRRALTADTCGGVSPSVNVCRLRSAIQAGRFLSSSGSSVSRTCARPKQWVGLGSPPSGAHTGRSHDQCCRGMLHAAVPAQAHMPACSRCMPNSQSPRILWRMLNIWYEMAAHWAAAHRSVCDSGHPQRCTSLQRGDLTETAPAAGPALTRPDTRVRTMTAAAAATCGHSCDSMSLTQPTRSRSGYRSHAGMLACRQAQRQQRHSLRSVPAQVARHTCMHAWLGSKQGSSTTL